MQNLQNELIKLLKNEDNLVVDNLLNKNKIIEAALKVEPYLIKLLIKNEIFKKYFFEEIESVLVFDKIKFQRFVNNKSFLPDSYTAFKNKIGLIINDETSDNFINTKNDIVLAWAYKDCILEGGQLKDDEKRDEIFWNETISPDNKDRLLDKKVLTNFVQYDINGKKKIEKVNHNENLVIKGNNLLVISSILNNYKEKVKLIYIDPPYNSKGDKASFSYNNTFNHSTFLTFMKNRLEVAKKFLTKDGFIAIAIDHNELFYLGVLCDEIFGRENRIGIISVVHKPEGRQNDKYFTATNEYMLVYANSKESKFNKVALTEDIIKSFDLKDNKGRYRLKEFLNNDMLERTARTKKPKNWYPIYVSNDLKKISLDNIDGSSTIFPITTNGTEKTWITIKETTEERIQKNELVAKRENGKIKIYYKFREQQRFKTHWVDKRYNATANGTNLVKKTVGDKYGRDVSYPKSVYTVLDTLKIMTKKDDIIMDFFGGSSTTGHATMMLNKEDGGNRKFIIVEQLNKHINVIIERTKSLIDKTYKNSSFLYFELLQFNQLYIDKIQDANNKDDLILIWEEMNKKAFLSYQFNKDIFNSSLDAFKTSSFEMMQKYLIEVLDKNQLYVNYSEIEDVSFNVSKEDKKLNYSFYKKNNSL